MFELVFFCIKISTIWSHCIKVFPNYHIRHTCTYGAIQNKNMIKKSLSCKSKKINMQLSKYKGQNDKQLEVYKTTKTLAELGSIERVSRYDRSKLVNLIDHLHIPDLILKLDVFHIF